MDKIKMICIKDLTDERGLWYKVGDFYEYNGLPAFYMLKLFYNNDGLATLNSLSMSREGLLNYFISYNEWLALQREEQIKSFLDD